ncbi:ProQ/FINO family protein [Rhodoferax sp.]|uniref:ProQ/FINO family protein n=1 Tax=Rhodoferax sp. TaxID=50421 RepID=UPI0039B9C88F
MTLTTTDATVPTDTPAPSTPPVSQATRLQNAQPVLEKLFALYPHLFGANFLPLKLGVFQELLAKHPDDFDRDTLKLALGVHTRSSRYLQCVAAGMKRHDLQGIAVDDVAPEHIYFALVELFRRKQLRSNEDLRPKLRVRLLAAFDASGLTRQDYQARVQTNDASANALLAEALAERDQQLAKQEALRRAFESSGKSVEEFADMYGMALRDVARALGPTDLRPTAP